MVDVSWWWIFVVEFVINHKKQTQGFVKQCGGFRKDHPVESADFESEKTELSKKSRFWSWQSQLIRRLEKTLGFYGPETNPFNDAQQKRYSIL